MLAVPAHREEGRNRAHRQRSAVASGARLATFKAAASSGPFQAFWLSDPPFDMQAVARWTEQAYREISTFFHDPDKPYFVFFRQNEAGALGGAALSGSFMVGYGDAPAPTSERLRFMLLKVHRGNDDLETSYVSRGAAVSGYRWSRVPGVPDSDCPL